MPATTGMVGGGFYDRHSTAQWASIEALLPWVEQAARGVPLPAGSGPAVFLDLGSAEGRNAVRVLTVAARALRGRTDRPIWTFYADLATNDFNRLFVNLRDAAGDSPPGVFAAAAAGSFYAPVLPSGTVQFASCFNSVLWLDHLPDVTLPDAVVYRRPHPPHPAGPMPAGADTAFAARAEDDLTRFYAARASELAPGGRLLLATPGDASDCRISDGLYDALDDACRALVAEGRLPRERYARFTMPVYFRTREELLAPLDRAGSPVRGAFRTERAESREIPVPFQEEFRRTRDADRLASELTGFLRAFSEPVARAALVTAGEDGSVLDALYGRVRDRVRADPERYRFRYFVSAVLLERR